MASAKWGKLGKVVKKKVPPKTGKKGMSQAKKDRGWGFGK